MKHHIVVSFSTNRLVNLVMGHKLKGYIETALNEQGVDFPCEINVMVTDDETIRAINKAGRGIDKSTDVLSFPMFELTPGELPEDISDMVDPDTGLVPLGDMAISLQHARAQAKEFGHSTAREIGYLTVHSVLHLLGYDHLDEGEMKKAMRAREEAILGKLNLLRE